MAAWANRARLATAYPRFALASIADTIRTLGAGRKEVNTYQPADPFTFARNRNGLRKGDRDVRRTGT